MDGANRRSRAVLTTLTFAVGVVAGVPAGLVLADLIEKENPQSMADLCADYATQEQLDDLFQQLQDRRGQAE